MSLNISRIEELRGNLLTVLTPVYLGSHEQLLLAAICGA